MRNKKAPKLALLLAGIALLTGCAKEDKYEVLSATRETRETATGDSDFAVFKLKHGQTIITAGCQKFTNDVEMKCAELAVGGRYALRRIRAAQQMLCCFETRNRKVAIHTSKVAVQFLSWKPKAFSNKALR